MTAITHRQQSIIDTLAAQPGDVSLESVAELLRADTMEVKYALFELCDLGLVRRTGVYRYALASIAAPSIEPRGDIVTVAELIEFMNAPYSEEDLKRMAAQDHATAVAIAAYLIRNPNWRERL